MLLECLKPGSESGHLILEILHFLIRKSSVSSFGGENPLDSAFEIGVGNFWSVGKWCADTGDLTTLIYWYKVFTELLASTISISDLNSALDAASVGLNVEYNAEVLHLAWSCIIRFCSPDRMTACPSIFPVLLHSCSIIGKANGNAEQGSSVFLHESALFVFLNCLLNVLLHGWNCFPSESRAILLRSVERDVIQVPMIHKLFIYDL